LIPGVLVLWMFKFKRNYFVLTAIIFVIEVLIALYVRDQFVRPYLGDVLVVILMYCFVRSFIELPVIPVAVFVLLFAFIIEFLQYIHIVEKLGLQNSKVISTVLGTSFVWNDMLAYLAGWVIILVGERLSANRKKPKTKFQKPNPKS
jgi:hypothetical protein